jgi:hypothetical protein
MTKKTSIRKTPFFITYATKAIIPAESGFPCPKVTHYP